MRRLATIEMVADIAPIPGADSIVRARIRGWDVVTRLGEFQPGDLCVYFEVDSMLDVTDPRFAFLAPRGLRTDTDGNTGHVLRTAKLRGQYSQGIALPLAAFPELNQDANPGADVTAALGIIKWEPPIPASLSGQVRGVRPSWIPATDEERIQNCADILTAEAEWVATEKIDGTSATFYIDPDSEHGFGVCSRNLDLLPNDGNTLWRMAREVDAERILREAFPGCPAVMQGEVYGEGIQGNPLRIKGQRFSAFTVRLGRDEVPRSEWPSAILALSVPVRTDLAFPGSLDQALGDVDKIRSLVSPDRLAEGVVWRAADRPTVTLPDGSSVRASFKVVSNGYLLKTGG